MIRRDEVSFGLKMGLSGSYFLTASSSLFNPSPVKSHAIALISVILLVTYVILSIFRYLHRHCKSGCNGKNNNPAIDPGVAIGLIFSGGIFCSVIFVSVFNPLNFGTICRVHFQYIYI